MRKEEEATGDFTEATEDITADTGDITEEAGVTEAGVGAAGVGAGALIGGGDITTLITMGLTTRIITPIIIILAAGRPYRRPGFNSRGSAFANGRAVHAPAIFCNLRC